MMAQNASAQQSRPAPFQSFGRDATAPGDVLENAKSVVSFLDVTLCRALSGGESLTGEQIFGLSLIFQATLSSLEIAEAAMKATRESSDRNTGSAEVYPRFSEGPIPDQAEPVPPPQAATGR